MFQLRNYPYNNKLVPVMQLHKNYRTDLTNIFYNAGFYMYYPELVIWD